MGGVGGQDRVEAAYRAVHARLWRSLLAFTGDAEGNFFAIDSKSGKLLWHYALGSALHGTSPTTYMLDGRQYLLIPAGTTLTAWALPDTRPSTR